MWLWIFEFWRKLTVFQQSQKIVKEEVREELQSVALIQEGKQEQDSTIYNCDQPIRAVCKAFDPARKIQKND